MAQPSKMTQETVTRICEAVATGATYEFACAVAGIDSATFRRWRERGEAETSGPYRAFCAFITRAEAAGVLASLEHINRAARDDWRAAAWLLEHRHPEHYAVSRLKIEHSGRVDVGVPVEVLAQLRQAIKQVFPGDRDAPQRLADALSSIRERSKSLTVQEP